MSIYFIETTSGQNYELNSSTLISKTLTGKLTDNPVESGSSLSDNFSQMPDSFSLEGIISDISSGGLSTTSQDQLSRKTGEVIKDLSDIKRNKQTFTFHFGDAIEASLNCMFESLSFAQDSKNGSARGVNSFKVKARFKQVNFAEKAVQTNERDTAFEDKYQKSEDNSQTTESTTTAGINIFQQGVDQVSGQVNNKNLYPDGA